MEVLWLKACGIKYINLFQMNFTTKENRHARAIVHRDTPGWRVSLWSSLRKLDLYAMRRTQINSKKKKTTRRRTGVRFDVIKLTIIR